MANGNGSTGVRTKRGKARARPASPKLLEAGRRGARDGTAEALGALWADIRERASYYEDPLLGLALDVLEGLREAILAEDRPALGKGATWGRKQRREPVARPATHVGLVRDLCDGPAEELAFKLLTSGKVSPLGVMTAAIQGWIDDAKERAKEPELHVKAVLMAAGLPESVASNWVHSALLRAGPEPPPGKR